MLFQRRASALEAHIWKHEKHLIVLIFQFSHVFPNRLHIEQHIDLWIFLRQTLCWTISVKARNFYPLELLQWHFICMLSQKSQPKNTQIPSIQQTEGKKTIKYIFLFCLKWIGFFFIGWLKGRKKSDGFLCHVSYSTMDNNEHYYCIEIILDFPKAPRR